MVMRTSTERHTYFSEDEKKVAKVYESYEGWFVEFYKDNVLVERRDLMIELLKERTIKYARIHTLLTSSFSPDH